MSRPTTHPSGRFFAASRSLLRLTFLGLLFAILPALSRAGIGLSLTSVSPVSGTVGVPVSPTLTLNYDAAVTAVAGKKLYIKQVADDSTVATIDAADATQVSVAGATVTVKPTGTLLYSTPYYILLDAGAFSSGPAGSPAISLKTDWTFTSFFQAAVTAADSFSFGSYFANASITQINLRANTTYVFPGGKLTRTLTISGPDATAILQAGAGVTDNVIRTGTVDGVTMTGLSDYNNQKVFLSVSGTLTLSNLTLQNNGVDALANGLFAIVNVKNGGSLITDRIVVKDFHNNPTPGNNLAFGFHTEPNAVKLTVTNTTFDSSNALRNVIAARGGALTITGNTFTGTKYPERLRSSDGYEYAIYIYGGWGDDGNPATLNDPGLVENNTINKYVATTQPGYGSAAIAVIGFYNVRLSIRNNVLSGNSGDVDITREWKPYSSPSPTVVVNGLPLSTSDEAFALGEQLRTANNTNQVNATLNQDDTVTVGSPTTYVTVVGGYRSPYLTLGAVTAQSAVVTFPSSQGDIDILTAATAITLETLRDDQSTWNTAWTNTSGAPASVTVPLAYGHKYKIRSKLVHTTNVPSTAVTYSAPVVADTNLPVLVSLLPADNATGVSPTSTFTATFDRAVTAVAGKNIVIRRASDDAAVATIAANDTKQVTIAGAVVTVAPATALRYSTDYYIQVDAGAFIDSASRPAAGIADKTSYSFTTEMRTTVTANDSAAFADYFANPNISQINLVANTTYVFPGAKLTRALTIAGPDSSAVLQAGAGVTDDVIRTGTAGGVTLSGLGDYLGVKVFLSVTGSLTLQNLTLQNNGVNALANGLFAVVNVKNGGSLTADRVVIHDFHNNPVPGTNLAYGFHSEPTAVKLSVTNCTFDSSNAFRNAVSPRGGALTITGNTFTGTKYPERLRNSDGYEYAIYVYGGSGAVENNTIQKYVATTQPGYGSAAIAVIGFYNINLSIRNNVFSGNSGDVDITREWQPFSTPSPVVTINNLPLTTADEAFAVGELMRTANNTDKSNATLNQGATIQAGPSSARYFTVVGGYRSPYLTLGTVNWQGATVTFPSIAAETDILAEATAITIETLRDDQSTWTTAWTNTTGVPTAVTIPLAYGHSYQIRSKQVHTTTVPSTAVTYSAIVSATIPTPTPVVSNSGTVNGTYGSPVTFSIAGSSPMGITQYSATGLPSGLSVNPTTGAVTGSPTQTGTFTATLSATNAAGTGSATVTISIAKAAATVQLTNTSYQYDGTPKSAMAVTTPAGLPVSISYSSGNPPVHAGSYTVTGSIVSANYAGSGSATLTITKAAQVLTFSAISGVQVGSSYTLVASSTSGGAVTYSVVSGPATISGSTLTVTGVGAITLRATQAGTQDYLPASVDQTIGTAKQSQTITFTPPTSHMTSDGSFALAASATSGLPVTFTLVSGPALLSGSNITLSGTPGTVVVRASQAGNDTYAAAPDVVLSFSVTPDVDRVFFGSVYLTSSRTSSLSSETRFPATSVVGDIAASIPARAHAGTLLIVAPGVGINAAIGFTLPDSGAFTTTTTQTLNGVSKSVTIRGQLSGSILSGTIDEIGLSFTTTVDASGPSAGAAGFYTSSALVSSQAVAYSIVGSNNQVLALAITPTATVGGTTTLKSDGSFQIDVAASSTTPAITLKGAVDAPTTTVSGTLVVGGQSTSFAGLKSTTTRTDRLINLSSRANVSGGEKILITGLVIGGTTPKPVLVRGIGPGLSKLGVNGALANPQIQIIQGSTVVAQNDDWGVASDPIALTKAMSRIGAFPLDTGSKDAALLTTLAPGAYTVLVTASGTTSQEGVAMAEIYDASENPQADYQRLINISSRGEVSSGEGILIGGFIITGNSPKKVLVRGIGPGLGALGVNNTLTDPLLKVYQGTTVLATNDNWSASATDAAAITSATKATGAFQLASGSKDAALILTLAPGFYTAHVASGDGSRGIALVEIYEIPE